MQGFKKVLFPMVFCIEYKQSDLQTHFFLYRILSIGLNYRKFNFPLLKGSSFGKSKY